MRVQIKIRKWVFTLASLNLQTRGLREQTPMTPEYKSIA